MEAENLAIFRRDWLNLVPVDLREHLLSLSQHNRAFNIERIHNEKVSEASGL